MENIQDLLQEMAITLNGYMQEADKNMSNFNLRTMDRDFRALSYRLTKLVDDRVLGLTDKPHKPTLEELESLREDCKNAHNMPGGDK